MANTFKNERISPSTAGGGISCPVGGTITIIGLSVSNSSESNITFRSTLTDYSAGNADAHINYNTVLPPDGNMVLAGGDQKIVLESQDQLRFFPSANSALRVFISYMLTT